MQPPTLSGSPVISDISLIRLSPHPAGPGESPFSAHHPYMNPHMEHYLRSVHSSPTLSMISAARGLSPADVAHEHLKERGLFGLAAPGTNPSDYYHQMTLMASHPAPYGDLLMQSGGAASAPHLHDYLNPVDGEYGMPFKHKTEEASLPAGLGRAKPAEDRPCKGPGAAVWAQESSVIGRNQVKARNGAEANVLEWAVPTRWGL
ncbi:hypothetical protein U0070_006998 [Myodes glareolus]|uniref:Uncharacterized protein n=1 Tax=Myodes glareolus TaxID=447135 RepID=A0AAW0ICL6_MYOGA